MIAETILTGVLAVATILFVLAAAFFAVVASVWLINELKGDK